jgi:hypothetical protein
VARGALAQELAPRGGGKGPCRQSAAKPAKSLENRAVWGPGEGGGFRSLRPQGKLQGREGGVAVEEPLRSLVKKLPVSLQLISALRGTLPMLPPIPTTCSCQPGG